MGSDTVLPYAKNVLEVSAHQFKYFGHSPAEYADARCWLVFVALLD